MPDEIEVITDTDHIGDELIRLYKEGKTTGTYRLEEQDPPQDVRLVILTNRA